MRDVIGMGLEGRTTMVKTEKLLATLKENREKHQREYKESLAGYQALATERLQQLKTRVEKSILDNFQAIQKKIDDFDPEEPEGLTDTVVLIQTASFNLKVPQDHTKSYDVAIQMAEWETREEIELTQDQFQCFVLDDWDWQQEFKYLNKAYSFAANR